LTAKRPASRTSGSVRADCSKHTSASSGSSETEQTAFAVRPPSPAGPATAIVQRTTEGPFRMMRGRMPRPKLSFLLPLFAVALALPLAACGEQTIEVASTSPQHAGAELFSQRCAGCHTFKAAATQVDEVLELDERRRELLPEVEALRAEQNQASEAIGEAKQAGEDASEAIAEMQEVARR
jgi:cytochrome c553